MRLTTLVLAAALIPTDGGAPEAPAAPRLRSAAEVVAHNQRHFDGAIELLAQRDLSALTATQREHRLALTRALAAYRDRGVFPHNYDFPGVAMPYFVDRKTGTLCAVAHLMTSTGRRDIVDRVAATDNNVWVAELAGDAEFRDWLDENGLTLEEAARIQLPYVEDPAPEPGAPRFLDARSILLTGAAFTFAAVNSGAAHRNVGRAAQVLGVATSLLAIANGVGPAKGSDIDPKMSALSIASGAVGLVAATHSFRQYQLRARVAPILPVGSNSGAGLAFSLTF